MARSTGCEGRPAHLRGGHATASKLVVVGEEVLDADALLVHAILDLRRARGVGFGRSSGRIRKPRATRPVLDGATRAIRFSRKAEPASARREAREECPRSPTSRTHQVERHLERDRLPREGRASRARVSDVARDFRRSGIARVARSRATTTETSSSSAPRPFENRDDGAGRPPPPAPQQVRARPPVLDSRWITRGTPATSRRCRLGVASARTSGLSRSPRSWPWRTWRWRACAVCRA